MGGRPQHTSIPRDRRQFKNVLEHIVDGSEVDDSVARWTAMKPTPTKDFPYGTGAMAWMPHDAHSRSRHRQVVPNFRSRRAPT
jgi:hypothetical protein